MDRDIKLLAAEFIAHKVSADYFALHLIEQIIVYRANHPKMIRVAQALYYMGHSGDGEG